MGDDLPPAFNFSVEQNFRFHVCDVFGAAHIFCLQLFPTDSLCNINGMCFGFIAFCDHSVENQWREVSKIVQDRLTTSE